MDDNSQHSKPRATLAAMDPSLVMISSQSSLAESFEPLSISMLETCLVRNIIFESIEKLKILMFQFLQIDQSLSDVMYADNLQQSCLTKDFSDGDNKHAMCVLRSLELLFNMLVEELGSMQSFESFAGEVMSLNKEANCHQLDPKINESFELVENNLRSMCNKYLGLGVLLKFTMNQCDSHPFTALPQLRYVKSFYDQKVIQYEDHIEHSKTEIRQEISNVAAKLRKEVCFQNQLNAMENEVEYMENEINFWMIKYEQDTDNLDNKVTRTGTQIDETQQKIANLKWEFEAREKQIEKRKRLYAAKTIQKWWRNWMKRMAEQNNKKKPKKAKAKRAKKPKKKAK